MTAGWSFAQAASGASYETEKGAYTACSQADSYLSVKAYEQARDILLKAAASDPTSYSSSVHLKLASAYRGLKDYQSAITHGQLALKYDPKSDVAAYNLSLIYYDIDQFDHANQYLQLYKQLTGDQASKNQALELSSEMVAYKNLKAASAAIDAGRYNEAIKLLKRAAASDPSRYSDNIHANLAWALERSGRPEEAIVEGEKALKFDPTSKNTVYTIGIAYQDLGKFNEAISWLRRYVTMETDDSARAQANNFIQELADDRVKINAADINKPDYYDQLKASNHADTWPNNRMPLKVFISSGKGVHGYRPIFKTFVLRSLDTWCAASGKKLSYKIVNKEGEASITVDWTRDPITMQESGRTRQKAGICYVDSTGEAIDSAKVHIRTVHAFDPAKLISDGECASTTMHEIGHAVGLGHSPGCGDIMYFGSSSKQTGFPTSRDKATLARMYKDHPVISFTPTAQPVATPTETDTPVRYLPPPGFLPPVPDDTRNLQPPTFLPPPKDGGKLRPPVFVPPTKEASVSEPDHATAAPVFTPPPLKPRSKERPDPRLFVPPPK